ncbi:MAG: chloride channel protein [Bernardetiaceae bacterium]
MKKRLHLARWRNFSKQINHQIIQFLLWKSKFISENNFVFFLSALVGILAGLAAVFLKSAVHWVQNSLAGEEFFVDDYDYGLLFYPTIGLLMTVFISRRIFQMDVGHGITDILYVIARKRAKMPARDLYARIVTSILTVGFGGSAGLEAPIVVTGAAVGSHTASAMLLQKENRVLLLGCGVAGVISAIFNAPVGGVIFALEVILAKVNISKIIPLLIASISAKVVSLLLLGEDVLFYFKIVDAYTPKDIPYTVLLGMICGLMSLYFMQVIARTERWMQRLSGIYVRALAGGLILTTIDIFFPPIYGEGYRLVKSFLNGSEFHVFYRSAFFGDLPSQPIFLTYVFLIVLVKPFANGVTLGAGGAGGTFAPSLFVGGILGFLFARVFNIWGGADLSESNFALVGMSGAMSGIQYAPLTAIFLIAELTSGYELFLPLMLAASIAYITVSFFQPQSPYVRALKARGVSERSGSDVAAIKKMRIHRLIEKDFEPITPESKLLDLVELIKVSRRNLFPVVDDQQNFLGIITLDDVRHCIFDPDQQQTPIHTLLKPSPAMIDYREDMMSAIEKFEQTQAWNLPVMRQGKYVGFLSKSNLFSAYRENLRHVAES